MKKDKIIILFVTLCVCVMIILFTVMIVFIGNHSGELASDAVNQPEVSFDVKEEDATVQNNTENQDMSVSDTQKEDISEMNIIELIHSEEEVDLSVEDTAVHDVEIENVYVNTQELLPSLRNEREIIYRDQVSTDNFPASYAKEEMTVITLNVPSGSSVTLSLPERVTLYNVEDEKSGSYEIAVSMDGDASIIKSFGWSTEDTSKLAFSKTSGEKTTIKSASDYTGKMQVSLIVTYYINESLTATEEIPIGVSIVNMSDNEEPLYDKYGSVLYLDKNGKKEAHLSDYDKYSQFYGMEETTGWQEIDGNMYYFNRAGWPVSGLQIIGGTQYTFDENGILIAGAGDKGIDVSRYQKEIDWEQVAACGISFAIIRCGFRGAVSGQLVEDAYYKQNIEGAKKAGIRVGLYFFTQAITEREAQEEAAMALQLCQDYDLDLPIYIDSEGAKNGRANSLDKKKRTKILKAFCERVEKGGKTAGVYASKCWYEEKLEVSQLEQYSIWVAQYNTICEYKGKMDYWQYSSQEHINGIVGNVDVNIAY